METAQIHVVKLSGNDVISTSGMSAAAIAAHNSNDQVVKIKSIDTSDGFFNTDMICYGYASNSNSYILFSESTTYSNKDGLYFDPAAMDQYVLGGYYHVDGNSERYYFTRCDLPHPGVN